MGSGMILSETELLIVENSNFSNFSSIFVKDRFQAVKNINDSFSFCGSSTVLMRMISKARKQL